MTPAQLDHLRAIDAHLAKLLDIAAKRTPGRWYSRGMKAHNASSEVVARTDTLDFLQKQSEHNAAFIASCAGNAEAGWKATRAVIQTLLDCNPTGHVGSPSSLLLDSILDAFPLESLKA